LLVKGGWIAVVHQYPVEMAQNFWTAIFACSSASIITITLSLLTKKAKTDEELVGLVYSLTPKMKEENVVWYKRSKTLAILVLVLVAILTVLFW
jgi:solute:Na+ symporter, SSS family